MAEDLGERTEEPTERRLQRAKDEGQHPVSRDLNAAVLLLAAIVGLHMISSWIANESMGMFEYCFREPWMDLGDGIDRARIEFSGLLGSVFKVLALWFGLLVVLAVGVNVAQTGGLRIATEKNYFDLTRLDPMKGLQRVFSVKSLMKTAIDIGKLILLGLVSYLFINSILGGLSNLSLMVFPMQGVWAAEQCFFLAYILALVLLILAMIDFFYQRYQYAQDLKMTKQEVKEETKDIEGDPQIKARRRQMQMQMAYRRMMQEVPEAEVVITNPTELAIAIGYDHDEHEAPRMIAKGADHVARRIREIAIENDIPIIENKPLARQLFKTTEPGEFIPESTFVAIAEILAYVYKITGRTPDLD